MDSPLWQILSAMAGMKVIFLLRNFSENWASHFISFHIPQRGKTSGWGEGWQDRHVQMQNAWCGTVWPQASCSRSPVRAANHLSRTTHLKVTLYTWKAPKIFSCLKGFKEGFILALCHNSIKAVTAKAGWCKDSPMPSLWGSWHVFPCTLDMVFSYKYYWDHSD